MNAEDGGRSFLLLTLARIYRTAWHLITQGSHKNSHFTERSKHKIQYLKDHESTLQLSYSNKDGQWLLARRSLFHALVTCQ